MLVRIPACQVWRTAALQASCVHRLASTASEARGKGNASSGSGSGFVRTEAGLNELYMRAVEPKPHPIEPLSEGELAKGKQLADTYTKLLWRRHHVMNKDLTRKMKLKWAAIAALPTLEMKREALTVDPYVPLWSKVPAATPPLKGFHSEVVEAEAATPAQEAGKGKSKEDKKKAAAQTSLAAAVRRGRGRDEADDESLFSLGTTKR